MRLVLNNKAIRDLLKSEAVQRDLERRVEAIAAAAGEGMEPSVRVGRNRVRGSVITGDWEAMRAEAKYRALTRAIQAGR